MNRKALFCDGTASYVIPAEPEPNQTVILRFRTEKDDVDRVSLVVPGKGQFQMGKAYTRGIFDYYEITWQLTSELFLIVSL